jgi:hypothetical protein
VIKKLLEYIYKQRTRIKRAKNKEKKLLEIETELCKKLDKENGKKNWSSNNF